MNDSTRRGYTIVVKNMPPKYTEADLFDLFSQFGSVHSTKVLPANPAFEGGYGFVNYSQAESCETAIKQMDGVNVGTFRLHVKLGMPFDRSLPNTQTNGVVPNAEEPPSPSAFQRVSNSRSTNDSSPFASQSRLIPKNIIDTSNSSPITAILNGSEQPSPSNIQLTIEPHPPLKLNEIYSVYLSNHELPAAVFAATLDDYIRATLLITRMNQIETVANAQANSYQSKLVVGEICAAKFAKDWYRARVIEIKENRVHVEYVDWGDTRWCDPVLDTRPLPVQYAKDPVLCVKCFLDGVPVDEKLSDQQKSAIQKILALDMKLTMTVVRMENSVSYVRLTLNERNLNDEVRAILSPSILLKTNSIIQFDSYRPELNLTKLHYVQLTAIDPQTEILHALLLRDSVVTIINTLKTWDVKKQPLTTPVQPGMIVCAQGKDDDLWYRAWIQSTADKMCRVYFVDVGKEELVPLDRLTECPDHLRTIPWQIIQIKLANAKLTDEERHELFQKFQNDILDMRIIDQQQNTFSVELVCNKKPLTEFITELRQKPKPPPPPPVVVPPVKTNVSKTPVNNPPRESMVSALSNRISSPLSNIISPPPSRTVITPAISTPPQTTDNSTNEHLITLISEQRRQNRLLEKIAAAVNTTNALLTQLVQRDASQVEQP